MNVRAGSERAADRGIGQPERLPGPAPLGARVSVRHARTAMIYNKRRLTPVARPVVAERVALRKAN